MLVHERLDCEWTVEESYMFTDLVTGERREVDIVARTEVGTYPIFLSIECRDHSRPADVLWIEGVAKKHEHLPTSKLVLWSRSGFTKAAVVKARALKIETISQAEANQVDWARFARAFIGGTVQHVMPKFNVYFCVSSSDDGVRRLEQVSDAVVYDGSYKQIGTVLDLVQFIASIPKAREIVLDNTDVGLGNFYFELSPVEPWFTELPEGGHAQIQRVGMSIETLTENVALDTASAESNGKVLTLVSAVLTTGTLEVLVEESSDGSASYWSSLRSKKG